MSSRDEVGFITVIRPSNLLIRSPLPTSGGVGKILLEMTICSLFPLRSSNQQENWECVGFG